MKKKYKTADIVSLSVNLMYSPDTGDIHWRRNRGHARKGHIAGGIHKACRTSYRIIKIMGVRMLAHRIAWALYYGKWPKDCLDHINGDGLDNRIANLREASYAVNNKNARRRKTNTSGSTGVSYRRFSGKWRSRITVDGSLVDLGSYVTHFAACYARHEANIKYGFHPNHGKT